MEIEPCSPLYGNSKKAVPSSSITPVKSDRMKENYIQEDKLKFEYFKLFAVP